MSSRAVFLRDPFARVARFCARLRSVVCGNTRAQSTVIFRQPLKRCFDFTGALLLLAAGAPVLALAILLVRITSRGPAIFRQVRVGEKGREFRILKLRTMVMDAEQKTGPVLSGEEDPRVTRVGRWLRLTHIDELPQLVNVLTGEMSLVGPRPERPYFVNLFSKQLPGYRSRLTVRPGITGLAQVNGCCSLTPERKLEYDIEYLRRASPVVDGKILIKTTWLVVRAGLTGIPAESTASEVWKRQAAHVARLGLE